MQVTPQLVVAHTSGWDPAPGKQMVQEVNGTLAGHDGNTIRRLFSEPPPPNNEPNVVSTAVPAEGGSVSQKPQPESARHSTPTPANHGDSDVKNRKKQPDNPYKRLINALKQRSEKPHHVDESANVGDENDENEEDDNGGKKKRGLFGRKKKKDKKGKKKKKKKKGKDSKSDKSDNSKKVKEAKGKKGKKDKKDKGKAKKPSTSTAKDKPGVDSQYVIPTTQSASASATGVRNTATGGRTSTKRGGARGKNRMHVLRTISMPSYKKRAISLMILLLGLTAVLLLVVCVLGFRTRWKFACWDPSQSVAHFDYRPFDK